MWGIGTYQCSSLPADTTKVVCVFVLVSWAIVVQKWLQMQRLGYTNARDGNIPMFTTAHGHHWSYPHVHTGESLPTSCCHHQGALVMLGMVARGTEMALDGKIRLYKCEVQGWEYQCSSLLVDTIKAVHMFALVGHGQQVIIVIKGSSPQS